MGLFKRFGTWLCSRGRHCMMEDGGMFVTPDTLECVWMYSCSRCKVEEQLWRRSRSGKTERRTNLPAGSNEHVRNMKSSFARILMAFEEVYGPLK